jgi:hypothetical protein
VTPERQLQAYVTPDGKEREKEKKNLKSTVQYTPHFPENLDRRAMNKVCGETEQF